MAKAERYGIYLCEICGNVVEMIRAGNGELVCCDEPMKLMDEQNADSTTEKHVPVIEKIGHGYRVTVGTTLHPMLEKHYIEWIELTADGKSCKKYLKPGDDPVAEFCVGDDVKTLTAREYCNIHGLWRS